MKRKIIFLVLLLVIIPTSFANILINEIFADPTDDESLNEWLELYNNGSSSVNLSNWIIGDDKNNDTLEGGLYNNGGTIIQGYGYAIITDDATRVYNNFNVSDNAIRLYADDSSIGNGLSNSGETISLYDGSNNLIHRIEYNSTTEDLSWSLANDSLSLSSPSPGSSNDGSMIESSNCDYAASFILEKTIFDNSSDFLFKIQASKVSGTATNFSLEASIEDLNGRIIKTYAPYTNESITRQRTSSEYTPNLEEGKSYILSANVSVECNDTSITNNFDTEIITIKGQSLDEDSSLDIERIYDLGSDDKAKFGQVIRVKLNAYKGNTNKKSVAVWVEDKKGKKLSKQSKTNLENKYTNYSLTLPIQIIPNCNGKLDDDDYVIVTKGIDSEDEEEIEIADLTDALCETIEATTNSKRASNLEFELKDFNNIVYSGDGIISKVILDNNGDASIPVNIWSYIYRGSKSYSGLREENMKSFILSSNTLQEIELKNVLEDVPPGNYKLKVLLNKDNQKTNKEIVKDIEVRNKKGETSIQNKNSQTGVNNLNNANQKSTGVIYESSTEKAKNLVPIFLIMLSILINIVFILRR
ncbi:lamin tail domain-containing protein [Candidatus Woesearchaeota archaeon]|nr:lamin tail domain-containing protein [Candidatus Woesearchaeota archaeon]